MDDALFGPHAPFVGTTHFSHRVEKQARQRLENVCLVDDRDLLPSIVNRIVIRELRDAQAAGSCIHAGADRDSVLVITNRDVVLESDIHAFDVLSNRDKVDILVSPARHQGQSRPNIGIEVELLAQSDIRRTIAAADRRLEGPFQCQSCFPDTVEGRGRQGISRVFNAGHSGLAGIPFEGRTERVENANRRIHDFGANTVPFNQGCGNL